MMAQTCSSATTKTACVLIINKILDTVVDTVTTESNSSASRPQSKQEEQTCNSYLMHVNNARHHKLFFYIVILQHVGLQLKVDLVKGVEHK